MADVREVEDLMVSDEVVEIDPDDLEAVEEGIRDLEAGRIHSAEEVRKLVKQWSTGLSTPTVR